MKFVCTCAVLLLVWTQIVKGQGQGDQRMTRAQCEVISDKTLVDDCSKCKARCVDITDDVLYCCIGTLVNGDDGTPGDTPGGSTREGVCGDLMDVISAIGTSAGEACLTDLSNVLMPGDTVENYCSYFWASMECLAPAVLASKQAETGADAVQQCLDDIRMYFRQEGAIQRVKSMLAQMGLNLGDPTFDPTVCKEFWDVPCSHIGDDSDDSCPASCTSNSNCDEANHQVCCPSKACGQVCVPDLTRCTDIQNIAAVAIANLDCASYFLSAVTQTYFEGYCSDTWTGFGCLSGKMVPEDFQKQCEDRIALYIQLSPSLVLDELKKYIPDLEVNQEFADNTAKCPENPLTEGPKKPIHEDIAVCSDPDEVLKKLQGCKTLSSSTPTEAVCEDFEELMECISENIFPDEEAGNMRLRCIRAMKELMVDQYVKLRQLSPKGRFDPTKCEERVNVCGGDNRPLEDETCSQREDCPSDYECKSGYCCPSEKEGVCPNTRGVTPICKSKCVKDSQCEDDEKCCNVGCGSKTCVKLESHQKGGCERDYENARKGLLESGPCGDGKSGVELPRCNKEKYHPTQIDADGNAYCVTEDGENIPGANMDCSKVHAGKCPVKPADCNDPNNVIKTCDDDDSCQMGQKCCVVQDSDACERKCVTAEQADDTVVDECQSRMCCPITLCLDAVCPADKTAVCRPNSCGDCKAEFFNVDEEIVDCETGVPMCVKERTMARQENARMAKSERERLNSLLDGQWRKNNDNDDRDDDDDDYDDDDEEDQRRNMMDGDGEYQDGDDMPDDPAKGTKLYDIEGEYKNVVKTMATARRFCQLFEKYDICNNGSCGLTADKPSYWQICLCPSGTYGLFCEMSGSLTPDTQCMHEKEYIEKYLQILTRDLTSRESHVISEMVNAFKIPNNLLPSPECDQAGEYLPVQKGTLLPMNRWSLHILYCVNTTTGDRDQTTPITLQESGQTPNCSDTGHVDVLNKPRMCMIPKPGDCGMDMTCQYYFNSKTRTCERGTPGRGFASLTECYDKCTLEWMCYPTPSGCPYNFYNSPIPCMNMQFTPERLLLSHCDFNTQFCNVMESPTGDQTGTCIDFPNHCVLPMDPGYGDMEYGGYVLYYFNATTRRCEKFRYSGQGGNKNRFFSLHQCHTECDTREYNYDDIVCPTPRALMASDMTNTMSDMCTSDSDCIGDQVCCSNGVARVCADPIGSCFTGERCSLEGWCENGKCMCPECPDDTTVQVCGSDGRTYGSECMVRRYSCMTMQKITVVKNEPCETSCGNFVCESYEICDNNQCSCPEVCTDDYTPVCGRSSRTGVMRTFSNQCQMAVYACASRELYVKVHDGECEGGQCQLACPNEDKPICAYNTTSSPASLVTISNACEMKRLKLCEMQKLDIFDIGECKSRQCGTQGIICQIYESCIDDSCGCQDACTREYMPVCASPKNNPYQTETFSNICEMKKKACNEAKLYFLVKKGPCETAEPEYECPSTKPDLPKSAELNCNPGTNSHCERDTERCCPHGAGTSCIPKKELVKTRVMKDGVCPRQMYVNFDESMCKTSRCSDDGDCVGRAKCCGNSFCRGMTCAEPIADNVCGVDLKPVRDLNCDPAADSDTCPTGSTCTRIHDGEESFGVCCMSVAGSDVAEEDIMNSRVCHLLSLVGVECMNGGTCIGDLNGNNMCTCPIGVHGPFCENVIPPPTCNSADECFANPCDVTTCPLYPTATCMSNYCGGCNALFSFNNEDVTSQCHATSCLKRKMISQFIYGKLFESDTDALYDELENYMKTIEQFADVDIDEIKEELDGDTLWNHFMMYLKKSGIKYIPVNGEIQCDETGMYEDKQCSVSLKDGEKFCHCVDKTTGRPIMKGPKSDLDDVDELSCQFNETTGFQQFCLEIPDMESTCSDSVTDRYFFNPEDNECELFIDRGCNDDIRNNFNDVKTCVSSCGPTKQWVGCAAVRCPVMCVMKDGEPTCVEDKPPGKFEPICDKDGKFEPKQCKGEVCRCVNPDTGEEVADSLSYRQKLTCVKDGDTVRAERDGDLNNCDGSDGSGVPEFCENSGHPCRQCEESTQEPDEYDRQVGDDGHCKSCDTCPAGSGRKKCPSRCDVNSVCKHFPGATCRPHRCTCAEHFYAGDVMVDCDKVQSQCKREKYRQESEQRAQGNAGNGGQSGQSGGGNNAQLKCSESGGYEASCTGNSCFCLNAASGERVGPAQTNTNINDIDCSEPQRNTKPSKVKFQMLVAKNKNLADLTTRVKEQIKRKIKQEIEDRSELKVEEVRLLQGSVIAETTVAKSDDYTGDADVPSLTSALISEINSDGGITVTTDDGQEFTTSDAAVTELLVEGPDPAPEPEPESQTTVIIIVVVVVAVVVIIAIVVAVYCYKKANKTKEQKVEFSNIDSGKLNMAYDKHV